MLHEYKLFLFQYMMSCQYVTDIVVPWTTFLLRPGIVPRRSKKESSKSSKGPTRLAKSFLKGKRTRRGRHLYPLETTSVLGCWRTNSTSLLPRHHIYLAHGWLMTIIPDHDDELGDGSFQHPDANVKVVQKPYNYWGINNLWSPGHIYHRPSQSVTM